MSDVRDAWSAIPHAPARARAVAVVGAGPRGASVLERLCASLPELSPGLRLTVHLVDPAPPGPGHVWRTDQSAELLMNTVASQVTLFTDDSVACEGPIRPGPSLYEWAADHTDERLGPDDYPTRACYGRYLEWVFLRTVGGAPDTVTVRVHRARAVRLEDDREPMAVSAEHAAAFQVPRAHTPLNNTAARAPAPTAAPRQTLTLDDGTVLTGLCAVILAQGHLPVVPRQAQAHLAEYAARHRRLRYFPPANPADLDLSAVAPGEPVLLRGLGLNFFDHMALLTTGRGGTFVRTDGGMLSYLPSGREPRLHAGSRRGVPYQARGDNAKGPSGRHEPLVLTPEVIAGFRMRADGGDPPDFLTEIWPLVAKEVEAVHYEALLAAGDGPTPCDVRGFQGFQDFRNVLDAENVTDFEDVRGSKVVRDFENVRDFRARFLDAPHGSAQEAAVLDAFGFAEADRWCWDRISRPHAGQCFSSPAEHHVWLLAHLRQDAAQAALGNVAGPRKAALDVLRDVRNELRQIVDHAGLSGTSRRDHLDRWYTPLNAFLSIGPPRRRIEEMTALIEAGVLEVVGPHTTIGMADGLFTAESPDVTGSLVTATTLIEARLPEPDLRRTCDELLGRLLKTGQCRPHTIDGYETGGLDVTRRPYRLINRQGRPHPRRFAIGVPTEGVHWVTAAGARPGVDSVTLSDADAVARAALRTLATTPTPTPTEPETGTEPESRAEIGHAINVELASID
ncbi:FAD/NAD(P)-binding protein [Streptomyces sp. NBC_01142]|uniref:FAD/NAD(P)-binding protein n=1 Tax=Streptomyces sp. NBC_01142 TaxID=2975865 RepID=UPI0022583C5E|nr:FAD/NAD(P)-binding protein [Streptomyces sp. NBC_01142]MCX4822798.1 FAD/NAD(P)-binding protein [Streptomyces sp. NBC_01142]